MAFPFPGRCTCEILVTTCYLFLMRWSPLAAVETKRKRSQRKGDDNDHNENVTSAFSFTSHRDHEENIHVYTVYTARYTTSFYY